MGNDYEKNSLYVGYYTMTPDAQARMVRIIEHKLAEKPGYALQFSALADHPGSLLSTPTNSADTTLVEEVRISDVNSMVDRLENHSAGDVRMTSVGRAIAELMCYGEDMTPKLGAYLQQAVQIATEQNYFSQHEAGRLRWCCDYALSHPEALPSVTPDTLQTMRAGLQQRMTQEFQTELERAQSVASGQTDYSENEEYKHIQYTLNFHHIGRVNKFFWENVGELPAQQETDIVAEARKIITRSAYAAIQEVRDAALHGTVNQFAIYEDLDNIKTTVLGRGDVHRFISADYNANPDVTPYHSDVPTIITDQIDRIAFNEILQSTTYQISQHFKAARNEPMLARLLERALSGWKNEAAPHVSEAAQTRYESNLPQRELANI